LHNVSIHKCVGFANELHRDFVSSPVAQVAADIDIGDYVGMAVVGQVGGGAWEVGGAHSHPLVEAAAAASQQRQVRSTLRPLLPAEDEVVAVPHPIQAVGLVPWNPIAMHAQRHLLPSVPLGDLLEAQDV
jgi:hypothetical protein